MTSIRKLMRLNGWRKGAHSDEYWMRFLKVGPFCHLEVKGDVYQLTMPDGGEVKGQGIDRIEVKGRDIDLIIRLADTCAEAMGGWE